MDNIIKIENLNKYYGKEKILDNINLEVEKGDFIAIEGASGSGKTTLLNLIGLLDNEYEGHIFYENRDIKKLKEKEINLFRNKNIGFIFQFHHLLKDFNVLENVILPSLLSYKFKEKESKAKELLKACNLENKIYEKISNLSGGEKQRVAIARALINDPKLLLADELTGNLDFYNSNLIFDLLKFFNITCKQTIIVVTHNKELSNIANKKFLLDSKTKNLVNKD